MHAYVATHEKEVRHMQTMVTRVHSEIEAVAKLNIATIRKTLTIHFERQCLSCRDFLVAPESVSYPRQDSRSVVEVGHVCGCSKQPTHTYVTHVQQNGPVTDLPR